MCGRQIEWPILANVSLLTSPTYSSNRHNSPHEVMLFLGLFTICMFISVHHSYMFLSSRSRLKDW